MTRSPALLMVAIRAPESKPPWPGGHGHSFRPGSSGIFFFGLLLSRFLLFSLFLFLFEFPVLA
jgi:hypothetical protein